MATRDVFSEEELRNSGASPEIGHGELIRYFTLGPADEACPCRAAGVLNAEPGGGASSARAAGPP